jgi:hypothetical protein
MNILFTTQTAGLKVFYSLLGRIKEPLGVEKVGFYVAHSMHYNRFLRDHPRLERDYPMVKEWEIVAKARKTKPDLSKIKEYEKALGTPTLWEPLICDRRVYLGRRCKERQDYRPTFTHEEMLSLLQVAVRELSLLLEEVEPDVILSLDPVTFGDYLFYLLASSNHIPILFFRTTKIKNYVRFEEQIFGCSPQLEKIYRRYEQEKIQDCWTKEAKEYLEKAGKDNIRYEGMILIPTKRQRRMVPGFSIRNLAGVMKTELEYLLHYRNDHHIPGVVAPILYRRLIIPAKARLTNWRYSGNYVRADELDSMEFAFYPIQSEPEIAALIWGKSHMNQIETARQIARSVPVGMKLILKEHPRALGYRSLRYYRKLLEIPNVLLAPPDLEVKPLIQKSKLVISMAGFVGFEAVVHKKPSIMLGGPRPFTILPDSMIRYVDSTNDLAEQIGDLLDSYEYREGPLIHYVAATIQGSVSIDYYTSILKKRGRHGDCGADRFEDELEKMAVYTVRRVREVLEMNN